MSVVAIVEDDRSLLKGVSRLLKAHGFGTAEFTSAEVLLESGAATEVNCLVLDVNLGGISGIELQRRLTSMGRRLPVIFITATESEAARREAIATGCIAYLRKPFDAQQLIEALTKAVGAP